MKVLGAELPEVFEGSKLLRGRP